MNQVMEERPKLGDQQCTGSLVALEDALYVIGGKWKLKVIIALQEGGSKRFNELQRMVTGISARVLSNELKELEMNGFVNRKVYAEQMPVVVEYVPTNYSRTLDEVLGALVKWGVEHRKKIISSS
jgi:DNA-binding HxlR family transcriptional regulator